MRISSLVNDIGPLADYAGTIPEAFSQRSITAYPQTHPKASISAQFRDGGVPLYRHTSPLSQTHINATSPIFNYNVTSCAGSFEVPQNMQIEVERKNTEFSNEHPVMEPRIIFSNYNQHSPFQLYQQQQYQTYPQVSSFSQQQTQLPVAVGRSTSPPTSFSHAESRQNEPDVGPLTRILPRLSLEGNGKHPEVYNYRENGIAAQSGDGEKKLDVKTEIPLESSNLGQGKSPLTTQTPTSVFATPRISRHRRTQSASSTMELVGLEDNSNLTKRKHICHFEGCGKNFSTSGHLARHRRLHTGEKPFACPIENCTSRFNRHDNMLQHYRSHQRKITNSGSHAFAPLSQEQPFSFTQLQTSSPSAGSQMLFEPSPENDAGSRNKYQQPVDQLDQRVQGEGGFQPPQLLPGNQAVRNLRNAHQFHRRHHSYSGTPVHMFPDSTPIMVPSTSNPPSSFPQYLRNGPYLTASNSAQAMPGPSFPGSGK